MQRKGRKNHAVGGRSLHLLRQQDTEAKPVFVRSRDSRRDAALALLEKWFGANDFSAHAARRVGVAVPVLKDLVRFGFVRFADGRYVLKIQIEKLRGDCWYRASFFRIDSAVMREYAPGSRSPGPESQAFEAVARKFFSDPDPESPYKRDPDHEPMHYFKRFRWPKSVYLLLTSRYRNLSAYIRYLVYTDLGMTAEAELEKSRMGPRV